MQTNYSLLAMSFFTIALSVANAHPGHDHSVPSGNWPTHTPDENLEVGIGGGFGVAAAMTDKPVQASVWKLSDGASGSSPQARTNNQIQNVLADVNTVAYDDEFVYVRTSGIPSHSIGPFRNQNELGDRDATYRISLHPDEADVHEMTRLANIGVMVNGAGLFNWSDATTWNRETNDLDMVSMGQFGDWNTNALWFRMAGLDAAGGHPAPNLYHYHLHPHALVEQLDPNNKGDHHSPLIGFAFDGFPIYGQYAYGNGVDESEGIRQMTSSYQLIEGRPADGPLEADFELGSFAEDFEYVEGTGTLNEFNMAFVNTPEYPDGTWAYFTTFDKDGSGTELDGDVAFPFTVGPRFFGEVDRLSVARNATINVPDDVKFEFVYSSIGSTGDCNGDGVVDTEDLSCVCGADSMSNVLDQTGLLRGDLDGDGEVAFPDFLILSEFFGQKDVGYASGDIDCDGTVGFSDFLFLSESFGQSATVAAVAPEPTAWALLVLALPIAGRLRRRSKREAVRR